MKSYRVGEYICRSHIWPWILSRIYEELSQLNGKNAIRVEHGHKTWNEEDIRWQITHEKMSAIRKI